MRNIIGLAKDASFYIRFHYFLVRFFNLHKRGIFTQFLLWPLYLLLSSFFSLKTSKIEYYYSNWSDYIYLDWADLFTVLKYFSKKKYYEKSQFDEVYRLFLLVFRNCLLNFYTFFPSELLTAFSVYHVW